MQAIAYIVQDPRVQPVLGAGERRRFKLKVNGQMGLSADVEELGSEFAQQYTVEFKRQHEALDVLGRLYGADLVDCSLRVSWGEDGSAAATGKFGATLQLTRLREALK
ncbi:MAG: hypothetical protein GY711_16720 [bacterium]|nr:hypothetical protein [bacterium]